MIYRGLLVKKGLNNNFLGSIEDLNIKDLPKNEVIVQVYYSSINYKDLMSYSGNFGVTRRFPHTPGIDASGIIISSNSESWKIGDKVIVVSSPLGMNVPGGFGQYISVSGEWLMKLPKKMSLLQSMAIGTAGYTAALAVKVVEEKIKASKNSKVAVSGATGGVGSIAVMLLNKLGYSVVAITGKKESVDFLRKIGASEVIFRDKFIEKTDRSLLPEEFNAAIDVAGGKTFTTLIRKCASGGVVIPTGMVESNNFQLSILPFILRGVKIEGINAEGVSFDMKEEIWLWLSNIIKDNEYKEFSNIFKLDDLIPTIDKIRNGQIYGRAVIDLGSDKIRI